MGDYGIHDATKPIGHANDLLNEQMSIYRYAA
jgi:hypothetical protein